MKKKENRNQNQNKDKNLQNLKNQNLHITKNKKISLLINKKKINIKVIIESTLLIEVKVKKKTIEKAHQHHHKGLKKAIMKGNMAIRKYLLIINFQNTRKLVV